MNESLGILSAVISLRHLWADQARLRLWWSWRWSWWLQGERLSHAVGCAFAICLERKQKRDKDSSTGVEVTFSQDKTSFTRMGSFRQTTLTERITDPQSAILAGKKSHSDSNLIYFTIINTQVWARMLVQGCHIW